MRQSACALANTQELKVQEGGARQRETGGGGRTINREVRMQDPTWPYFTSEAAASNRAGRTMKEDAAHLCRTFDKLAKLTGEIANCSGRMMCVHARTRTHTRLHRRGNQCARHHGAQSMRSTACACVNVRAVLSVSQTNIREM